eukprot:m.352744 g.352744  ORF g.352744 m.352744 type:complete len:266 (-) comp16607_c0_seq1:534-1331(-)
MSTTQDIFTPEADANSPLARAGCIQMHDLAPTASSQWQIIGDNSQLLEVILQPGDFVSTEPGTMVHKSLDLSANVHIAGGCGDACTRSYCAGESFFRVKYGNKTDQPQHLGLTPNFPAKVVPLHLSEFGGQCTIKNQAFLASINAVPTFSYRLAKCGAGCFGGQGFVLNDLNGDGTVFLNASGTVLLRRLAPGETLVCDQNSVVAFQSTCDFDIRTAGGLCMCCFGGEGMFQATLTGPGLVVLQSMPVEKIARSLQKSVESTRPQ